VGQKDQEPLGCLVSLRHGLTHQLSDLPSPARSSTEGECSTLRSVCQIGAALHCRGPSLDPVACGDKAHNTTASAICQIAEGTGV
jgi:hypothetical protein